MSDISNQSIAMRTTFDVSKIALLLTSALNFLFLIRPEPNIHDFFTFDFPDLFRGRLFITSVIRCNTESAGLSRFFSEVLAQ
jgi:hypothetical protein